MMTRTDAVWRSLSNRARGGKEIVWVLAAAVLFLIWGLDFETSPASGQEIFWTRNLGTEAANEQAQSVAVDGEGNIYVVGWTYGTFPGQTRNFPGQMSAFLRKIDPNGDEIWTRQLDISGAYGVTVDKTGSVFVVGSILDHLPGQLDWTQMGFLSKYDSNGNEIWKRQSGAFGFRETGYGVAIDEAGNSYMIGLSIGPRVEGTGLYSGYVRKLDSDANEMWTRDVCTVVRFQIILW